MESTDDCSIIYSTLADLARFEYVTGETLQITEENSENLYEEEQQFKSITALRLIKRKWSLLCLNLHFKKICKFFYPVISITSSSNFFSNFQWFLYLLLLLLFNLTHKKIDWILFPHLQVTFKDWIKSSKLWFMWLW